MILKRLILIAFLGNVMLMAYAQNYSNIEFIENKGQWDSRVKFKGDVSNGSVFVRAGGFTVLQHNPEDQKVIQAIMHGHHENGKPLLPDSRLVLRSHAWNVDFVGASPNMQVIPDKPLQTYNNYFKGDDPAKWASNCRIFQAVTLKDVYPNIDVRYYTDNGTLKYDIIVKPGGDPKKIALKYEGVNSLQVKKGELVIRTSLGELRESAPYTYQSFKDREKNEVSCKYVVRGNTVTFDVRNYDPTQTLVIDPSLIFCSFTGSTIDNWGYTATYGPDGAFYGGGIVFGAGFPTSPGAFQTVFQGTGSDAFDIGIMKLSANGGNRIYATYIGGSGEEQPHSIVVDDGGNLVVAGRTNSGNYPLGTALGLIGTGGAHDIVITKLNATGSALIGSVKIGGSGEDGVNITTIRSGSNSLHRNYGDDGRSEVILDRSGNILVASSTQSSSFPVTPGAFQTTIGGSQDAVVLKFNASLSSMLFASFLGGSANDAGYVLAIGTNNNIYVAGGTESANFPGNKAGTIGPALNGSIDGYIAEINSSGSAIVRSTFIGTSGIDQVFGIQFDRLGFPYITGQTTGNWVAQNAVFVNPGAKQFISKLQPNLSANVYTTTFGTSSSVPNISITAFLVDRCENVYVSGWGGGLLPGYQSAGTSGMPITPDALDPSTDGDDFYFFVLRRDATAQLYGSFFGQTGGTGDHVDGGTSRFDQNGVIYQAICANCGGGVSYPTTPGSWAVSKPASANCNLAMVKIAMNLSGVGSDVSSAIDGVPNDTAGCVPLTVQLTDRVRNAESYIWNFGDGGGDIGPLPAATGFTQTHTYNAVGTYRVMLVAINPNTCNIRDTSYINIKVSDLRAIVDFSATKIGPCNQFQYRFDNLSVAPPGFPFSDTAFIWNFGDGSPTVVAGLTSVNHTYSSPGTYNVILTMRDTVYCNSPATDTLRLSVDENVDAIFTAPTAGCVPFTWTFDNESVAGQTWQWFFGDGNTSTDFEPTHTYTAPGTYQVMLVATNPNTCNVTDTARQTITVYSIPVADFSYTPTTPIENSPHFFTNLSSPEAVSFKWIWGDGDTLRTNSRAIVQHQYNATGTFTACLVAFNAAGCSDTTCYPVEALITPVVGVPNAFTPNSGDINSIVMVKGFGISKMRFIIWNRWGQKVFETGDRNKGWDGKVNGQIQPMDVYAYTLDVEFFDGTKASKKGDITLIR